MDMRKETYLGHFHLSLSLSFNKLGTLFFIFHLFFLAPVHMKIYIYKPIDLEMERDGIFFLFFFFFGVGWGCTLWVWVLSHFLSIFFHLVVFLLSSPGGKSLYFACGVLYSSLYSSFLASL